MRFLRVISIAILVSQMTLKVQAHQPLLSEHESIVPSNFAKNASTISAESRVGSKDEPSNTHAHVAPSYEKTIDLPNAKTAFVSLPDVAREVLAIHFHQSRFRSLSDYLGCLEIPKRYQMRAPVFVTLSRNGKTRACWGSLFPTEQDLIHATIFTTERAITKEYRFQPIKPSEVCHLKPQVTVVRGLQPITGIEGQNPMRYGLFVRANGRTAVLLPGEAADPYYQLVQCKLKAGIPSSQPCQLYRINADVFK